MIHRRNLFIALLGPLMGHIKPKRAGHSREFTLDLSRARGEVPLREWLETPEAIPAVVKELMPHCPPQDPLLRMKAEGLVNQLRNRMAGLPPRPSVADYWSQE